LKLKTFAALGLALAVTTGAASAQFDENDYYVSVPFVAGASGIYVADSETGVTTPFSLGLLIPHYGWFGHDGNFYVPDRGFPALMKITPDGVATPLSLGGHFQKPVTCIPTMDGSAWVVSDMEAHKIVQVDYDGNQTLLHDATSTGGLLAGPDGIAFDDHGNLYVANLLTDTVVKIDTAGNATLFADDPALIRAPGGLTIDGAGNLYIANYDLHTIVRFRLDTGAGSVFAGPDLEKMVFPNDLKLSRDGGLIVAGRQGRVTRVDAVGNLSVIFEVPELIEYDGVAVKQDANYCSGRYETYGEGTPGTGGLEPYFGAIFSPCSGHIIGLEFRDFVGGTPAILFVSSGSLPNGALKFKGADMVVDPAGAVFMTLPLFIPGTGAGGGDMTLQFTVPAMTGLDGLQLFHQVFAADPAAPKGVSASNGLLETFGL